MRVVLLAADEGERDLRGRNGRGEMPIHDGRGACVSDGDGQALVLRSELARGERRSEELHREAGDTVVVLSVGSGHD